MKNLMICLCGLPRSGKSTISNKIMNLINNLIVISTDEIRLMENIKPEKSSKTDDVYQKACQQLEVESTYKNIVFDACCYSSSKRNLIIKSTSKNSLTCLVELSIDLNTIFDRVRKIKDVDLKILGVNDINVISKMNIQFEWPSLYEKNNYDFYFKFEWIGHRWYCSEKTNNTTNNSYEYNFIDYVLTKI